MKINIQLFGGRGANSGYGGGTNTGGRGRGPTAFYDKTGKYKGMTMHEFENAVRDKKVEYIGIYDKDGKLIVAGTSNSPHAVAIPTNHPDFNQAYTLTHNHPYAPAEEPNRTIGATFSEADVKNHIALRLKGETRAVSNGPNENTYIFREKSGAKQNTKKMIEIANGLDKYWSKEKVKVDKEISSRLAKQGKQPLSAARHNQVTYGLVKRLWKSQEVESTGYEYIEVKGKHW